jgi:MEDS: MEthanogen/methylotroph, DcmR Sensory domain
MGAGDSARPGVEGLLEYEAKANEVPFTDPVVCRYDLRRFRGDVVVEVMRTHPMVIIGEILQENPFFVPPDRFLRELRARRSGSTLSAPARG